MREAYGRALEFLRFLRSGRQQLEQTSQQLKQTRRRLQQTRRRLEQTRQQLKQTRQQQLKPTKRELRQTRQQLKQVMREREQAERRLNEARQRLYERRLQLKQITREHLLCRMPKQSVCAEIGVHEGEFAKQILDTVNPRRLHLIDPWRHAEGERYQSSQYGGLGSDGQNTMDKRYERVSEQLAEEIRADQVQIHRDLSSVVSDGFEDRYFDWIYIDGNHLYEFVKQDLELYYPKVKDEGYIAGDDYGVEGWWENGVQRAVDEFISQRSDLTLEIKGTQFIIKKRRA